MSAAEGGNTGDGDFFIFGDWACCVYVVCEPVMINVILRAYRSPKSANIISLWVIGSYFGAQSWFILAVSGKIARCISPPTCTSKVLALSTS